MSGATINNISNLFIDKSKKPDDGELGIMNLGKNCSFCSQLDFLPFQCEFCNEIFCSDHRNVEIHKCKGLDKFNNQYSRSPSPPSNLPSSKTLFPDREAHKRQIDAALATSGNKPTSIFEKAAASAQTQFRVGDVAKTTPNAFKKLQRFLQLQRSKSSLLKSKSSKSASAKIADISLLKKSAKGDSKIPISDRIYIWCLFLNHSKNNTSDEEDQQFKNIKIEKERKPIFVSKNWVVGRALDSIANELHIPNINNSTVDINEKLNIFKLNESQDEPIVVKNNLKTLQAFKNGDILYLVKGTI
ncbi:hypothetical protein DFJ63DRAFT_144521 [Scheffersomyces coipomensis]|uniref:uncharacterized protein n=1 Tax=Scheffersomyces coipomensis TaxID=1788519 RepID=UPI00315CB0CB